MLCFVLIFKGERIFSDLKFSDWCIGCEMQKGAAVRKTTGAWGQDLFQGKSDAN